jgi:hypothetical protein
MRKHLLLPLFALAPALLAGRNLSVLTTLTLDAPNTVAIESNLESWPEGATFVEASKGLPYKGGTPNWQDASASEPTGYRILNLTVLPGEEVKFKMKSEDDKVSMRVHVPEPPPEHKWLVALKWANKPYLGHARPRLAVKNETDKPQKLGLIIFGKHGYQYRVDMERIPAKP